MPTLTNNFSYNTPLVNNATDADLWGGQLNTNWDGLDTDLAVTTSAESADFSVLSDEFNYFYLIDSSSANVTATLPAASAVFNGFIVHFKAVDLTNNITVDGNGSETIDGETTLSLETLNDAVSIVCDGSNWRIVSSKITPRVNGSQVTQSTPQSTTSTSYIDATGLSITITPSMSTSSVSISCSINCEQNGTDGRASTFRIMRDINGGGFSDITGDQTLSFDHDQGGATNLTTLNFWDAPATTDICTYKIQIRTTNSSSTVTIQNGGRVSYLIAEEKV